MSRWVPPFNTQWSQNAADSGEMEKTKCPNIRSLISRCIPCHPTCYTKPKKKLQQIQQKLSKSKKKSENKNEIYKKTKWFQYFFSVF